MRIRLAQTLLSTRLLSFGAQVDKNTEILAPMYPFPSELVAYAASNGSTPVLMSEYSHAMGNSLGGFAHYWSVIRRHKILQGGFIWDWRDQGIASVSPTGQPMWAYGGDFGPAGTPSDGIFCANGLTQPDGRLNPHAHEVRIVRRLVWSVVQCGAQYSMVHSNSIVKIV